MRERMLAGELYIADDPRSRPRPDRAMSLCHRLNRLDPTDAARRRRILAELLGAFGEDTEIRPPFYCDYGYQTFVGARTFANFGLIASTSPRHDRRRRADRAERAAAHPDPPGRARASARQVGGRPADHHRRQRVARRRRHRLPRRRPSARTRSSAPGRSSQGTCRPTRRGRQPRASRQVAGHQPSCWSCPHSPTASMRRLTDTVVGRRERRGDRGCRGLVAPGARGDRGRRTRCGRLPARDARELRLHVGRAEALLRLDVPPDRRVAVARRRGGRLVWGDRGPPLGLYVHGRYDTAGAVRSVLSIVGAL